VPIPTRYRQRTFSQPSPEAFPITSGVETTYPSPAQVSPPSISLPLVSKSPYPGPSDGATNYLDWSEVEKAILNGDISEAYQSHTLHVTLVKKNGDIILTIEPSIDEVFRVLDRCGDSCKDVIRATE